MRSVTVRYWAAARAAAGVAQEDLPAGSLEEVLAAAVTAHGPRLERVLGYATFLVDGAPAHRHDAGPLSGVVLEVLPPFAGGAA